jgi:DNA-binding transcriptional ArsR family regulator
LATASVRVGSRATFLKRLAVVLADPIRMRIVNELFDREMSPSQFQAAYGGGSLGRVDSHFKRLAEFGWLRLVRQATGGRRRGSTEHFYRAPELVVFDNETWAALPKSLRAELSRGTHRAFGELVEEAIEAGTFDAREGRRLTSTSLVLDERGREAAIAAVDSLFASLFEEQTDARLRISRSGETPLHATIGLAAFDSPSPRQTRPGRLSPPSGSGPAGEPMPFTLRVAKVLGNPLNLRIVAALNQREMSPSQFVEEVGGTSVSDVNRRFKRLVEIGWLVKVGEETGGRRRGATEHFYRATGSALVDTEWWSQVSDRVRGTYGWRAFERHAEQVREAMDAGTFDAQTDRHHSWTPLVLDRLGWEQVIAGVEGVLHRLPQEQGAAKARLAETGDEPIFATVCLAAFESPGPPTYGAGDRRF